MASRSEVSSIDHGVNGRRQAGFRRTAWLDQQASCPRHGGFVALCLVGLGSAQPPVMKGDQYRKFLKDNEQSTKKLMGW